MAAEGGYTLTPSKLSNSVRGTPTPSPTGYGPAGQDPTASQKKHSELMSKIFPSGVDEVRKDHDYARKLFDEDRGDHTAQPRTAQHQHHHHHRMSESHARSLEIKRELVEEQRASDEDVDMDRPEDHADDESQTPGGQSDNSGRESHYHDAAEHELQQQFRQESLRQEPTPAPQPTGESSQTMTTVSQRRASSRRAEATGSTVA
jgi:hypothetical protein